VADADGLGFNGDLKFFKTQTQRFDLLANPNSSCSKLDRGFPPPRKDGDGWREWIGDGLCPPVVRRGPNGFPRGLDVRPRLKALGNAVCPQQGAEAFRQLMTRAGFGKVRS
jgi:hypothetical protein